ncbi:MAG: ribosome biogenesis GTPase Der [Bacteroidetes bacterium]|nr:ribosome biogenesis GTPase Der [Bacteroidota bacterium]MBK9424610.1 ribosome biogenesis GTPase Der [Bacteroidota bacterium]MBL0070846.1 ribosome biogenesis GTPase Der [Bacteroidota bacterium]
MANIVAIVGRPNVGKSTLFNRLTESRKAIVDEASGVTRDRHYGKADWNGKSFSLIDTGGYVRGSDDVFEDEIRKQVVLAVEEADVIIFVVDVTTGLTDLDDEVAGMLRKSGKKIVVVANKVDSSARAFEHTDFYKLGLGEIYTISAISGSGTGELLDEVVKDFNSDEPEETEIPKIAIVGQPNVGKSSLLNTLLGLERTIVTPIAGTTRDTIYTRYKGFGFDFFLIDTAGLRRKARVKEDIEFYSVMRTIRAIEESDVCIVMIDATVGLTAQDINIYHLAEKNKKGIVLLVNKWDLIETATKNTKKVEEEIRAKLAPFNDIPIIFTSVLHKQRIHKALEVALEVFQNRKQRIATSVLNKVMLPFIEHYPPPATKGKTISIKYVTQLPGGNPHFAFFCNLPQYIKDPYRRYIENKLRESFNFQGVPISLHFRPKND